MIDDFDLITGSSFQLFFAFYKTNASFPTKLILVLFGMFTGLLLYFVLSKWGSIKKNNYYFLSLLLRLYMIESVLFYKIYFLDIDVAIPICITPFLFIICFLLPNDISDCTYRSAAKWTLAILSILFLSMLFTVSQDQFKDIIDDMPTPFIFFNCLWFVLENGYISILYILFFIIVDTLNPVLTRVIWQSNSIYFVIIQGIVLIYTCMIYSIRIREIYPQYYHKSKKAIIMHALILNVSIFYMKEVALLSGLFTILLLGYKAFEVLKLKV